MPMDTSVLPNVSDAVQLKQLDGVVSVGKAAADKATSLATAAATYAPAPVASAASAVYGRVAPALLPYAEKTLEVVKPRAEAALLSVDGRVDTVVIAVQSFYSRNHAIASARYAQLQALVADGRSRVAESADGYFAVIDAGLKAVMGKLNDVMSTDAVNLAAERLAALRAMIKDAVPKERLQHHLAQLHSAWEAVLARPDVGNLLEYSNSSVKSLSARAETVHDAIVTDPRYSSLLDSASGWVNWAQATSLGSKLSTYATPYAAALQQTKYAEAAAPYATRMVEYWKPATPLEGIKTK